MVNADLSSDELDCVKLPSEESTRAGPCRTEFSDVGFDFIVVGTNKF